MIKREHSARGFSWPKANVKTIYNETIGYRTLFRFRLSGNVSNESCIMYSVFNRVHQLLFCVMISTAFGSQGDL